MTASTPAYRGKIARDSDGVVRGEIRETLTGWPMQLVLTRTAEGYDVAGFLGPAPDWLKVPGVDGEIGKA